MSRVARMALFSRKFTTSAIRKSAHDDHDTSGIPGSNLPFKIDNRFGLTIKFALFFGIAFAIPFYAVRFHLTKKTG
ncbi:cytochrome c oxidase subunit 7C, mitochondrial-like [Dermacentor variabilis]|uniref:cytochrome c oxidase subunit 7C, mitochondrial-like n=1 Tax=Dermacentor variabilis TaxID=34621 RepID=UPI003F5C8511